LRKADDKQLPILYSWLRLVFSLKGIWFFFPGILGMLFVYWAEANGYQALVLKKYHEQIAIGLMGVATVLFLMRAVFYRMEIDYILAVMSMNFLCRELHFVGTDNAVVIIAGLCLIWALLRKNQFWTSIRQAKLFQISLTGTAFTYFFSILISRRVFSIDHLALLPNEANVHVALEEVLENIAHLFLIFSGIVAFFSINKQHRKHAKFSRITATMTRKHKE
jgi:hypothetical protein